jgi:hypothetical protein
MIGQTNKRRKEPFIVLVVVFVQSKGSKHRASIRALLLGFRCKPIVHSYLARPVRSTRDQAGYGRHWSASAVQLGSKSPARTP